MQGKDSNFIWGYAGVLNSDLGVPSGFYFDMGVGK
jgi:hypothetical protein